MSMIGRLIARHLFMRAYVVGHVKPHWCIRLPLGHALWRLGDAGLRLTRWA